MINEYGFYLEIIDLFNYSYYNWKPKLVLVLIHNSPTSSWSYLMIFPRLMIEKSFPYSDTIHNYSSISNKLFFDVMTASLILALSYFSLLDIDLFCRPRRL